MATMVGRFARPRTSLATLGSLGTRRATPEMSGRSCRTGLIGRPDPVRGPLVTVITGSGSWATSIPVRVVKRSIAQTIAVTVADVVSADAQTTLPLAPIRQYRAAAILSIWVLGDLAHREGDATDEVARGDLRPRK